MMVPKTSGSSRSQGRYPPLPPRWGVLAAVCTSPLYILFVYLGDPGRGRAAWISAAIVFVVVRKFWALRRRVWFWLTVTTIALCHVPLVLLIRWGNQSLSYVALLPAAFLDYAIAYKIIRLVEKVIERNGSPEAGVRSNPRG